MRGSCQVTGSRLAFWQLCLLFVPIYYLCIPLLVTPTMNHCHFFLAAVLLLGVSVGLSHTSPVSIHLSFQMAPCVCRVAYILKLFLVLSSKYQVNLSAWPIGLKSLGIGFVHLWLGSGRSLHTLLAFSPLSHKTIPVYEPFFSGIWKRLTS